MAVNISWLGHASFKIEGEGNFKVYIDPWKIKGKDEADLVLITHSHYDHLSPEDVDKLKGKETQILVTADATDKLKGKVRGVRPGENISLPNVDVRTVPAYNTDKPNHPKANGWVGYILQIGDISIYHAGDTDFIPEMKEIKPYVALLPIGGTYTMDVKDALKAAKVLAPRLVIPMHYAEIVGSVDDAKSFARECEFEVKVLGKGESIEVKA